jgi:hypothetical protein
MQELSRQNRGHRYIITVIDCLSKYTWARAIKNKKSESIIEAFKDIFESDNRIRAYVRTDKGRV